MAQPPKVWTGSWEQAYQLIIRGKAGASRGDPNLQPKVNYLSAMGVQSIVPVRTAKPQPATITSQRQLSPQEIENIKNPYNTYPTSKTTQINTPIPQKKIGGINQSALTGSGAPTYLNPEQYKSYSGSEPVFEVKPTPLGAQAVDISEFTSGINLSKKKNPLTNSLSRGQYEYNKMQLDLARIGYNIQRDTYAGKDTSARQKEYYSLFTSEGSLTPSAEKEFKQSAKKSFQALSAKERFKLKLTEIITAGTQAGLNLKYGYINFQTGIFQNTVAFDNEGKRIKGGFQPTPNEKSILNIPTVQTTTTFKESPLQWIKETIATRPAPIINTALGVYLIKGGVKGVNKNIETTGGFKSGVTKTVEGASPIQFNTKFIPNTQQAFVLDSKPFNTRVVKQGNLQISTTETKNLYPSIKGDTKIYQVTTQYSKPIGNNKFIGASKTGTSGPVVDYSGGNFKLSRVDTFSNNVFVGKPSGKGAVAKGVSFTKIDNKIISKSFTSYGEVKTIGKINIFQSGETRIYKYPVETGDGFKVSDFRLTAGELRGTIQNIGMEGSSTTGGTSTSGTTTKTKFTIPFISEPQISTPTTTTKTDIKGVSFSAPTKTKGFQSAVFIQQPKVKTDTKTFISGASDYSFRTRTKQTSGNTFFTPSFTDSRSRQDTITIPTIKPIQDTVIVPKVITINPPTTKGRGTFTPPPTTFTGRGWDYRNTIIPPKLPTYVLGSLGGLGLSSKTSKGGKSVLRYTPSFSALFYKIKGEKQKNVRETGINFRPITKGFSFSGTIKGIAIINRKGLPNSNFKNFNIPLKKYYTVKKSRKKRR